MTEIEQKALRAELQSMRWQRELTEQLLKRAEAKLEAERTAHAATKAEAEAFKREVSDAMSDLDRRLDDAEYSPDSNTRLIVRRFILPKPVDPIREEISALAKQHGCSLSEEGLNAMVEYFAARNLTITDKSA